jgi:hypothetical protein
MDFIGAFVTLLGLLLMGVFNQYFGMTQIILNFLSVIASLFFVYDISCLFLIKENWWFPLKIIGTANLIYCIITVSVLFFRYTDLTMLGVIYFIVEIIIVCLVAYVELNTSVQK